MKKISLRESQKYLVYSIKDLLLMMITKSEIIVTILEIVEELLIVLQFKI